MTEYLTLCSSVRTPFCYHQPALKYILGDLDENRKILWIDLQEDFVVKDGEKLLQQLFDKDRVKMRMYGSPKELIENINIYSKFPGSHRHLDGDCDPYFVTPTLYECYNSDEKFICKSEIFTVFQTLVAKANPFFTPVFINTIAFFLKSEEKKLDGYVEFVPFDEEFLHGIYRKIEEIRDNKEDLCFNDLSTHQLIDEFTMTTMLRGRITCPQYLLDKFQEFIPNDWDLLETTRLITLFTNFEHDFRSFRRDQQPLLFTFMFFEIKMYMELFQTVINEHPELFLPNPEAKAREIDREKIRERGEMKERMKARLEKIKAREAAMTEEERAELEEKRKVARAELHKRLEAERQKRMEEEDSESEVESESEMVEQVSLTGERVMQPCLNLPTGTRVKSASSSVDQRAKQFYLNQPPISRMRQANRRTPELRVKRATSPVDHLVNLQTEPRAKQEISPSHLQAKRVIPPPNTTKVTVRLFEDGSQQFLMLSDHFNSLGPHYGPHPLCEHTIQTIPFQEALQQAQNENRSEHIQYIRYPILRSKHRAVPINGCHPSTPDYCILAVDALFEYLQLQILEYKVFQKCENWTEIEQKFQEMEMFFRPNMTAPYFLRDAAIKKLHSSTHRLAEIKEAKYIRNAMKDGFTVQNLKNELAHLALTVTFPEIQDHAEVVYAHVDSVKKEKVLRTYDLIDAVESCQLICVFERLPKYKQFLHNQKGCGRVPGLTCRLCSMKDKEVEMPEVTVEPTESMEQLKTKIAELELENAKLKEELASEKESTNVFKEKLVEKVIECEELRFERGDWNFQ